MELKIADSWINISQSEFDKPYFKSLASFVASAHENHLCFPKEEDIFAAFDFCSFNNLKVVIIGQDPYHGENQANGLCFSVKEGLKHPQSLVNIFKEVATDLNQESPQSGSL
jgi:uracil-DNA glycosylase